MKSIFKGASSTALLIGLFAGAAYAQTPTAAPDQVSKPAPTSDAAPDRVVVTGSNIAGASEDAALPVEVIDNATLEKTGSPNAMEFLKSLTIQGDTGGVTQYLGGGGAGVSQFNLRGLGSGRTLTLLNGRRTSSNSTNIPSAVVQRIEILKDGAATIYGADAVGGVVNYITKRNFEGLEVSGEYRWIKDVEPEYTLSAVTGMGDADSAFIFSMEYEHRDKLEVEDRDFSMQPYEVNPAAWSTTSNPTFYRFFTGPPAAGVRETGANQFGTAIGAAIGDYTPASCSAIGGTATATACNFFYMPWYNLAEESDIYRIYSQYAGSIGDHADFRIDFSYTQRKLSASSSTFPSLRGPAIASGGTSQYYVPSTNPYYADFLTQSAAGGAAPAGANGLVITGAYRPFSFGGAPDWIAAGNKGAPSLKTENEAWHISAGLKGEAPDWMHVGGIKYDVAATYNQEFSSVNGWDIIGYRLQEALNGFGGPGCSVADQDPTRLGTQNATIGSSAAARAAVGCYYYNPFTSAFAANAQLGNANPRYITGHDNRADLTRWLQGDRAYETINTDLTFDGVISGTIPAVKLPGGELGWAAGGQWRQLELRNINNDPLNNGSTPCEWPGQTPLNINDASYNGCGLDRSGPYVFNSPVIPQNLDRQTFSYYGELAVPVLDNLNFQLAARHEEFSGGLKATVYKVAGKWDVTQNFGLRASYGTNYRAPDITLVPGRVTTAFSGLNAAANVFKGVVTTTAGSIKPETADVGNLGAIWDSGGFLPDSRLRVSLDYFNMKIYDQVATASVNGIADAVISGAVSADGTKYANCSSPLRDNVEFNNGNVCVQFTGANGALATKGSDISLVRTVQTNGPGLQTSGADLSIDYSLPVGPGDLSVGTQVTQYFDYFIDGFSYNGLTVQTPLQALGKANYLVTAANGSHPRVRANTYLNYSLGEHNVRAVVNYVSGVRDARGGIAIANTFKADNNYTAATANPVSYWGIDPQNWVTFDLHYLVQLPAGFTLNASALNIFDRDPPAARVEFGYNAALGNPYGRYFQVGLRKTF